MEKIWFRKTSDGLLWKPVAWQGWVLIAVWACANVWKVTEIEKFSDSVSDTLLNAAPFFIVTTLCLLLMIRKTTSRPR